MGEVPTRVLPARPSTHPALHEQGAKVAVTNVDESLTREQVESHFASYGRVLDVYRQAEHAVVHLQFASAEVALRVVSRTHVINGRKVVVERELTESPAEEGWRIYVVCSKYIQEVQLSRFFEEHGEVVKTKMLRDGRGDAAGFKWYLPTVTTAPHRPAGLLRAHGAATHPGARLGPLRSLRGGLQPSQSVLKMRVSRFRPTGNSRGCAFVTFRERTSAELAVQRCHGVDLKGRVLKVMMADRRKPSDPPPSDGASAAEAAAPGAAAAPAVVVAAGQPAAAAGATADEPAAAAARLPPVLEVAEGGDAPRMWGLEALLARVGAAGRVGAAEAARGGEAWRGEAVQRVAEASEVMREAGTERAGRQLRAAESLLRTLDAGASEDPELALHVAFRGALRSERRAACRKLELTIDAELAAVDAQLAALDALGAPPTDTEEEPASTAEALLASAHDAVAAAEEAHVRAAAAHGDSLRAELARRSAHAQGLTGSAAAAARRALLREAGRQAALLVAVQMGEPAEVRVGRGGELLRHQPLFALTSPSPTSCLSRPSPPRPAPLPHPPPLPHPSPPSPQVGVALLEQRQAALSVLREHLAPRSATAPAPPSAAELLHLGGCTARPLLQKQAAMDLLLQTNEHQLAHCRAQLAREERQERLGRRRAAAQIADAKIVGPWPSLLLAGPRGTVGVAPATPGGVAAVPMLWGLS
jgi:RNA recognition motif-containing protein